MWGGAEVLVHPLGLKPESQSLHHQHPPTSLNFSSIQQKQASTIRRHPLPAPPSLAGLSANPTAKLHHQYDTAAGAPSITSHQICCIRSAASASAPTYVSPPPITHYNSFLEPLTTDRGTNATPPTVFNVPRKSQLPAAHPQVTPLFYIS